MREILFRGKRIDNGEWVFGNLVIHETDNSEVNFISNNETVVDVFIQPIKKVWDTHWNSFGRQEWKAVSPMLKVDTATIGQYTGLMDKNGRRIFEGDIVKRCFTLTRSEHRKTRETQVGVVRYKNSDCAFWLENTCNLRRPWPEDTLEVIGNIHDNPELLKEEWP